MKRVAAISMAVLTLMVGNAGAVTYTEVGDAGETLATAQVLPGGTTVVEGYLAAGTADMFTFGWGGGAFYVNSVGTPFDSQLFLFDAGGHGVQGNDDGIAFGGPAYLQLASLDSGTYYLGFSGYNYDPLNASGALLFQSYPFESLYGPLNPLDTLDHWGSSGGGGNNYTINFSSTSALGELGDTNPTVDAIPTPEPSTFLLLGGGLAGMAVWRRKRAS